MVFQAKIAKCQTDDRGAYENEIIIDELDQIAKQVLATNKIGQIFRFLLSL